MINFITIIALFSFPTFISRCHSFIFPVTALYFKYYVGIIQNIKRKYKRSQSFLSRLRDMDFFHNFQLSLYQEKKS